MEETKCYCGHTTTCDCGPEEPKQETLEEYIENYNKLPNGVFKTYVGGYIDGSKWQQEKSYIEEDLKEAFFDGWVSRDGDLPFTKAKNKWFKEFKKEIR